MSQRAVHPPFALGVQVSETLPDEDTHVAERSGFLNSLSAQTFHYDQKNASQSVLLFSHDRVRRPSPRWGLGGLDNGRALDDGKLEKFLSLATFETIASLIPA